MPYHIALAGKGSAGKSSLLPLIIAAVREQRPDARLLVVDADPQQGATTVLGVQPSTTLGAVLRENAQTLRSGTGLNEARDAYLRSHIQEIILRDNPYDFLAMGRSDVAGCQCIVNNLLKRALMIVMQEYDILITDNEAGLEHMGRFADIPIDHLLLIALADSLFLDVAQLIYQQGFDAGRTINQATLLLNQANELDKDEYEAQIATMERMGIAYGGEIPALLAMEEYPIAFFEQAYWWPDVREMLTFVLALNEEASNAAVAPGYSA